MGSTFIPAPDGDFNSWVGNFYGYANANLVALGLVPGDLAPVALAIGVWSNAYAGNTSAQAAAEAAATAKVEARKSLESVVRALVNRLQASPVVSDQERQALGITVRDKNPTPIPPPATRPEAAADTSQRLRHVLRFNDETTPTRRAKPAGVAACHIFAKIGGEPPTDVSECTFVGASSRDKFTVNYAGDDGNKTAHYMVCWVNGKGERGPWSETVSATIAA